MTVEYLVLPCMRDGKEVRILAQEVLKQEARHGNYWKNWPEEKSIKINNNTCTICLQKPISYNSVQSFNFPPILFDKMKKYGFSTMHKRVRNFEFEWKGAERKESKLTGVNLKTVRLNWQKGLRELTGIDPFRPDPINRGNTNDGNLSRRFHENPSLSSSVVKLDPTIIALREYCWIC